jgi:hypothetical protein
MHKRRVVLVVVAAVVALVPERHSGEKDHRDDEHDSGDDGNPCRGEEDPWGPV